MAVKTCDKCNSKFKNQRALDQHKRRKIPCTAGTVCSKCQKDFNTTSMLARHMKRKTPCAPEEVPVIIGENNENRCQFCNNTYSTKSNLKRHQQTCDKDNNMEVMVKLLLTKVDTMHETHQKEMQEMKQMMSQQLTTPNQTFIRKDFELDLNICDGIFLCRVGGKGRHTRTSQGKS